MGTNLLEKSVGSNNTSTAVRTRESNRTGPLSARGDLVGGNYDRFEVTKGQTEYSSVWLGQTKAGQVGPLEQLGREQLHKTMALGRYKMN